MDFQNVAPLGKKNVITDTGLLGQVARFLDLNYASAGVQPQLTHIPIYARLVINNSGGALSPGEIVLPDVTATYGPGRGAGAAISTGELASGVVDPWLGVDVPDDETFWLIFRGPAKFLFTTGTELAIGDVIQSGDAGRAIQYDVSSPSAGGNLLACGRVLEAVASGVASDTLFRAIADFKYQPN